MGIFSSKTKIDVFSNALKLADPDDNLIAKTILGGILSGQEITDGLTYLAFDGISARVDRMMNYARDSYTLGLPQGSNSQTTVLDEADVIAAITADIPLTWSCSLDFNFVAPLTEVHIALPHLEKQRNYDIRTGLLTEHPPGIVYPTPPAPGVGQTWIEDTHRMTYTHAEFNQDLTTDVATITIYYDLETTHHYRTEIYDWEQGPDPVVTFQQVVVNQEETEDLVVASGQTGYRFGQSYCVAKYYKEIDAIGTLSETADWWFYDIAAETYAALNYTPDTSAETNTLMPVVPMRYDNDDMADVAHQATPLYLTSKKLLKKIDIDIEDLQTALNDNPDVNDIDHAYVMFGINLRQPSEISIRYLAAFFDYLHDIALVNQQDLVNSLIHALPVGNAQYVFGDFLNPGGSTTETFTEYTDWNETTYTIKIQNSNNPVSLEEQGLDVGIEYNEISSTEMVGVIGDRGFADIVLEGNTGTIYNNTYTAVDTSLVTFRWQHTATRYKIIRVRGLTHYNRVYKKKTIWTTIDDVLANWDEDEDAEDNFVIPLHYGIARSFSPYVRNYLYLESMHLIAQSIVKTKVKWYQKGVFKVISLIVAVAILYFTGNPIFLKLWVISMAMDILSQILPADLLAILQVVYLIYQVYALDWTALMEGTATAAEMMTAATMAVQVAQLPIQWRMRNLQGEFEDLADQIKAEGQELSEAQTLLDVSGFLDPGLMLNSAPYLPMFFKSPTDMFNMRIHDKNPGVRSLRNVDFYVTQKLQLPDNSYQGK